MPPSQDERFAREDRAARLIAEAAAEIEELEEFAGSAMVIDCLFLAAASQWRRARTGARPGG